MAIALRRPSPGQITSGFGVRAGGLHEGIDFGWGNGWSIYAAATGVVTWAGPGAGYGTRYGNLTIINHGGYETRYAHQSRIDVRVGQQVSVGQAIGVIGGSGASGPNTYAPHLHFELLIGGKRVNPAPYFTSTAGGGVTPIVVIEPEEESEHEMRVIYNQDAPASQDATRRAVVGEFTFKVITGPQSTRERKLWGDPVNVTQGEWDAQRMSVEENRRAFGMPSIDYAEFAKVVALAVAATPPSVTPAQIAKAVNDDAAERLRN
ncbi:M23 family metallopeptidase [Cryobacterium sp. BB736]|uniref:M23 family metallopeptidase n=1 Tax=Cryobacterium sp. BB736 TaxID=2746963 RepID=UPI001876A318|nr:M23 family metallopeptidase [Cryobacterium sp. BB736]